MALDSLTGQRPTTGSTAEAAAAPKGRDIPEMLWDAITSMRLGIVLIVFMAVLAFLGTVIEQAPSAMLSDAQAKASFIAGVRPRYGGWTNVLDTLGLFNVFNSIWFTGTVGVLTASLLACSANRIGGILKVARHSRVAVHERFIEHAPHHDHIEVAGDRSALTATVVKTIKKHGYRPVVEDDGVVHVYADRFRWSPLASVVAHLSLVVILAGVIVGTVFGYRDDSFAIAEGQTKAVQTDEGLTVKLVSFTSSYYTDNGMPSDYASDVILYKDGQQVAEHVTRVNDPMRYSSPGRLGDLVFYQASYGPAVHLTVTDASGTQVFSDGVPLAWQTNDGRTLGDVTLKDRNLTVYVVGHQVDFSNNQTDPLQPGQMDVELYDGTTGAPIAQQRLDQRSPTTVNGLTFTFDREMEFSNLAVARDPGGALIWLGAALLAGGFMIVFFLPSRRVWARMVVGADGRGALSLAAPTNNHFGADSDYASLVSDLRAAVASPLSA